MDSKTQEREKIAPDYKRIYSDILKEQHPEKRQDCERLLMKKQLSVIDILELNKKIFGRAEEVSQKYRSYSKSDILQILDYQKSKNLNNSQLANHFKLSRNSVTKWKKIFIV